VRYVLESRFPVPVDRLFAFHERKDALDILAPPGVGVEVLERAPSLAPGSRTRFRVRLAPGLWIASEAEHVALEKDVYFEDRQIRGPFRLWHHRHFFRPDGPDASVLRDEIEYQPPFGLLGRLFAPWVVERRLDRMFRYRHEATRRALESETAAPESG
jgi:ligand-binding SRPBCC domain-containing protein